MVAVLLITMALPAQDAFTAPGVQDCWVQPLQVSLSELAAMGQISENVVRNHCSRYIKSDYPRFPGRTFDVARTRLGSFRLFGEKLSYGFDVVVQPGQLGQHDTIYTTPALDLPESWQNVIDKATYPALAIGGTAIITAIIIQALD